jgi:fructosamine-3-kinase
MEANPAAGLSRALDLPAAGAGLRPLGHGFGVRARLDAGGHSFLTKRLPMSEADPLDAEADGLQRLARAGVLRVPAVHARIDLDGERWLVLEWLDLRPLSRDGAARLGSQLAEHHRAATAEHHGLERDNWIGGTPQANTSTGDWTHFLFEHRIGALIERLTAAGTELGTALPDRLRESWQRDFAAYCPTPSLIHGDLWNGNAGLLPDGRPVVFDPAVHYGDRECDLAMAALFGGFDPAFFDHYRRSWPPAPGWERRRAYYQLYHVLNHALLFGGAYVGDARRRIEGLLRAPP